MTLFSTPQNMDLFTRYMVEMFDENSAAAGVSTCWLPFFGDPNAAGSGTYFSPDKNAVDIDIIRGNEKYAKMRLRGVSGSTNIGDTLKALRTERFTSISRTYPLMEDTAYIGADQLLSRGAGESPYMDATKQSRLRKLAVREVNEIQRRFVRGFNKLAGQSLLEGVQDAIFGTSDTAQQYDFYRNSNLTYTVPVAWDNASAVITTNIDTACDRIRQYGRTTPDAMFADGAVVDAMIADSEIQAVNANRRYFFSGFGTAVTGAPVMPPKYQKFVDAGWIFRGVIETPKGYKLHVFTTVDIIEEDGGTFSTMVPSGEALICNTMVRADRYFGPDERMPMIPEDAQRLRSYFGIDITQPSPGNLNIKDAAALIRPDMFMFDAEVTRSSATICCQSAPIFAPVHTDAYCTLNGLLT